MSYSSRLFFSMAGLYCAGLVFDSFFAVGSIGLVPFYVFISISLVWLLRNPGRLLIGTAVLLELFSSLPPGIVLVSMAAPYVIRRVYFREDIDFSFTFLGLIALSAGLQMIVVVSAVIGESARLTFASPELPWKYLGYALIATTLCVFACTVLWQNWLMPKEHGISTVESRRIA